MITSENFVEGVLRTDTPITPELIARISDPNTIRLIHAVLGMVTESAELADMLKRHLFYGKPIDVVNGKEELGDTLWYVGLAIDVFKTTMNDILTMNINKLKLRYPEKFNEVDAVERDLTSERSLLESHAENNGYVDVSDKEYRDMNNLVLRNNCLNRQYLKTTSVRGQNWLDFAFKVLDHIEKYTVPQYGDKGEDQVTNYDSYDCIKQVQKYAARMGRNAREGQDLLDMIKMAHYTQLAHEKYQEE